MWLNLKDKKYRSHLITLGVGIGSIVLAWILYVFILDLFGLPTDQKENIAGSLYGIGFFLFCWQISGGMVEYGCEGL